jgi:hypothetical protein
MGWTNYTEPVEPAKWIPPIDLNLYAKGLQAQQEFAEKNIQDITNNFNNLFSRSAYGPDKRKLKELAEQFKQETASLNLSNLSDINTFSKIKGLINKYSSDPEATAAIKRGSIWDSELEKKQKAEEKGESYTSPALTTLESYFNQDNFYEKPEGLNLALGWISPNDAADAKKAKEMVEKRTRIVERPDGTRYSETYLDPVELQEALRVIQSSNPNYEKDRRFKFDTANKGTDWKAYAKETYTPLIEEAKSNAEKAKTLYNSTNDQNKKAYYLKEYEKALRISDAYSSFLDDDFTAEQIKEQAFSSYLANQREKIVSTMDAVQEAHVAMNEVKKSGMDLSNDIYKEDRKLIAKGAMLLGLDPDAVIRNPELAKQAIDAVNNYDIGNFEKKKEIEKDIKVKASAEKAKKLSQIKSDQLLPYYDLNGNVKTATWGTIKEKTKDYQTARADKQFILELINTLRSRKGDPPLIDIERLEISPNGQLSYDNGLISWGSTNLTNLTSLANPQTYMDLDIKFNEGTESETSGTSRIPNSENARRGAR